MFRIYFFFFQAEDGIRDADVTGVQTCALPIYLRSQHGYSRRVLRELAQNPKRPVILITTGGGAQGYPLINNYMQFLERMNGGLPFQSVIVTGPMMMKVAQAELIEHSMPLAHV